ncbi:MAG: insulinase family protein [Bacteroidales bacterium]|nr:insulinase family protein [Bacteroidales bacterium]
MLRTGSKNDPADNTGLSHYLEHMMFKGTTHFGTSDYGKEAPLLRQIEALFEEYRQTADTLKRKEIYKQIDLVSAEAAKYAIANEYDKLLSVIGAKGTNAFTGSEQTVYINDIPSNQIEKWLKIESDRFANPVFRIFHTELETVYEEKNMSLDRDSDKLWEAMYAGLYRKHPYGTQTTIGTIDHLKNPSLKRLREYYEERYAPNNMALIMAGDFDPDLTIALIDKYFGVLNKRKVASFKSPSETELNNPLVKEVIGPDAESIAIGFRTGGVHTPDANLLDIASEILSNGKAGLIDINLNLGQKVLSANAGADIQADYSALILSGKPKTGQSLDEVKDLLLSQLELLKNGEFSESLIPAIINNRKLSKIRQQESNMSRAMAIAGIFVTEQPYSEMVNEIEILSKITKKEVVDFAKKSFNSNYVIVYKRTGTDEEVKKVSKPEITPVVMQRDKESTFFTEVSSMKSTEIKPLFLSYENDIKKIKLTNGLNVMYVPNTESSLFNLYYYYNMGSQSDPKLAIAVNYLSYLGTSDIKAEQLKQEFYKLGCSYSVNVNNEDLYISLSGLYENLSKALGLLDQLISRAVPDDKALKNLVDDILKSRRDNKLNKNIIRQALSNYGVYGSKSPFTNILSEEDLKQLNAEELVGKIHELMSFQHEILYYGPVFMGNTGKAVSNKTKEKNTFSIIMENHVIPKTLNPVPNVVRFAQLPTTENKVFVVDYNMKQVDIVFHALSGKYNLTEYPLIRMFNEYFGAGMNSIVFQEIREAKALAYSSTAAYRIPSNEVENNTVFAFVGTQNDKMGDALDAMLSLFNDMPLSEKSFAAAKEGIMNQISSERITKSRIIFNYLNARKMGYDHDIRKNVFEKVPEFSFEEIKKFQQMNLKDKTFTILVVGDTKKMDLEKLSKYGKIEFLDLQNIFGY